MKSSAFHVKDDDEPSLINAWNVLPLGARSALEQQWAGLAASGLPCGSVVLNADREVIAAGRNHTYDSAGLLDTRTTSPLQYTRLAHAELNAIALIPTEVDHATLTLWSTQHPCSMCAAAIRFIGIGSVRFIADDPSDDSSAEEIVASRGGVVYQALNEPLWWTISNLLFLYTSAVQKGSEAGSLRMNRGRYAELVRLTLDLARGDSLGVVARSGTALPDSLELHVHEIRRVSQFAPK